MRLAAQRRAPEHAATNLEAPLRAIGMYRCAVRVASDIDIPLFRAQQDLSVVPGVSQRQLSIQAGRLDVSLAIRNVLPPPIRASASSAFR